MARQEGALAAHDRYKQALRESIRQERQRKRQEEIQQAEEIASMSDQAVRSVRSMAAMSYFAIILVLFTMVGAGAGLVKYMVIDGMTSSTTSNIVTIVLPDGRTWTAPGDMSKENFEQFMRLASMSLQVHAAKVATSETTKAAPLSDAVRPPDKQGHDHSKRETKKH